MIPAADQLAIDRIGEGRFESPLIGRRDFKGDRDVVLVAGTREEARAISGETPGFEPAGPRRLLAFDPGEVVAGVVSCGGLCPGINNVIRAIVLTLRWAYGVERVWGFRYGFAGLIPEPVAEPLALTPELVEPIHRWGGTVLGSSRGPQDVAKMVDNLELLGVGILFAIGGDGTLKGAHAIAAEIQRRGRPIAVVAVPKTIDNDIAWIERSFGFASAVEAACRSISGAHAEAAGALYGVGLVQLMGRHAGFIAAHATLALSDVNFCLVPESPFRLEPLMAALEERLRRRRHAVVVVAEGAGQDLFAEEAAQDASGNRKLHDIGRRLQDEIKRFFEGKLPATLKYIDPSYLVRSVPAIADDAEYCLLLGQHAVHAAMAGRTDLLIGRWHDRFTHVPIALAVAHRKRLPPETWQRVLESTGQPDFQ